MNVTLSPLLSRLIEHEIESGHFSTPEEVIAAGVSRVFAESNLSIEEIADLRAEIQIGIQQANRGEFTEFTAKDIIAQGRALISNNAEQNGK